MVDISSQNNKINVTVSSSGNTANTNVTHDYAQYYSEKSKEWAISNRIVDDTDYSSKYYANESKKQADISTAKATEVVESGNIAVSNIESARDNAIIDVNTAGATQITNVNSAGTTQINLAKEQVTLATNQAKIATNKTSEVVASGKTALANITTAKNNAITTITTQETTSKNNVIATGNEQVERVNLTGVDNRTPIFSKSEIGTNESVYKNVYDMKHSAFDKSKFNVVGSPTITNDGIVSGFSTNDYISKVLNKSYNNIVIRGKFKLNDATTYNILYSNSSTNFINYLFASCDNSSNRMYKPLIGIGAKSALGTNALKSNVDYLFEVIYKNNNIIVNFTNLISQSIESTITVNNVDKIEFETLFIGKNFYATGRELKGSIDLKQFSITVDGKEVFNGNKTGIDTIKADNYEVVGSPVISNDGVLSNCTFNADYVSSKQTFNLYNANTWEIQCHYNPMGLSNKSEYFMFYSPTINSNGLHLGYKTKSTLQLTVFENGNNVILSNPNIPLNWESYTDYLFKVRFTGTQYLLDYSKDNGNTWIKLLTVNSNKKTVSSPVYVRNGIYSSSGIDYGIKIGITDLNQTKVYIDGNLVYQPCLKIPYTQSKTGSKIVDGVYRDRVIDLYEQEGQAGYYTIDEENKNFTLPMGEIYGMIEQKADKLTVEESLSTKADVTTPSIQAPYLKNTYVNGTSGYNIWSNGYCEQWGAGTHNASVKTITLLKNFKNTYYHIDCNWLARAYDTYYQLMPYIVNSSSFEVSSYTQQNNKPFIWKATGYLAEGEY